MSTPHPTLVDIQSMSFDVDSLGHLIVRDKNSTFGNVTPVRLFPLSHPNEWISLIDNQTGKEIACIERIDTLPPNSAKMLETEFSKREFVPILKRVIWVSGNSEPSQWRVETDRGTTSFVVKHEDDVRRLGEIGVLIIDSYGIRYFIPDRSQLDPYSRRVIEWYV